MIFESLWPLAFLLAVPVVIILYLLVPKGEDTKISSNLLWEKLFKNQQSKTFWDKFLHNLLMYLQIVILLLLILALMSPYISKKGTGGGNTIYLLDTSGSMQHLTKSGDTRLEASVKEIREEMKASEGVWSVVTNDGTGTSLLSVNSSDRQKIAASLKKVSCSDTAGDLSKAAGTVQTLLGEEGKGNVVVYTDGIGAKAAEKLTEQLSAEVRVMGEPVNNVAVTFLSCTAESGAVPERMKANDGGEDANASPDTAGAEASGEESAVEEGDTAAVGLVNYSDQTATLELSLYEDEKILEIRELSLKPEETFTCLFHGLSWDGEPLHAQISSVSFEGEEGGDSLAADNCVYSAAAEDKQIQAVLIGEGNLYLEKVYQAVTGQNLSKVKPGDVSSMENFPGLTGSDDGKTAGKNQRQKDAVVCIYDAGTAAIQEETASRMVFYDSSCAGGKKKNVSLSASDTELTAGISSLTFGVNETYTYEVPEWGVGFLWAGEDCAGYYGEHDGVRQVVLGFDLRESDFALKAEFPVLMANALNFLTDSSLLAQNVYEAGDTVLFHAQADVDVSTLSAPTDKAGLYPVKAGDKEESYVVRFARDQSDGRITAEGTAAVSKAGAQSVRRQLRRVILLLVLLLLVMEWICYVRQMRYRGKFYLCVRLVLFCLVVLSLAGISVNRKGSADTTIFLVDLSKSNEQNLEAMNQDLSDMIEKMPEKNRYGIVAFGKDAVVDQFLTREKHFSGILSTPEQAATNIEDAILKGLSMIPEDAAGRLVVLTDGKETRGSAMNTVSALASGQTELLSVLYDTSQGKDAYMENVELPSYLYAGDSYSMTATVVSNFDTDAALQIVQGTEIKSESKVHLNKGSNQFVLKQKVFGESLESFDVRVTAEGDTCEENNTFRACAVVNSLPKVLVISGLKEDSANFSGLLDAAGVNSSVVSAVNAPDSLEAMLAYKSIVLENVHRTDLPEGFLNNIETYVKDYGCGLICCGGEESFALGGYRDSELETVLPVEMELRGANELPTLAMVMVIDHSGSMSEDAGDGSGATNLDLAVTAANAAVDELRDRDYVGVVTFDDRFSWQLPITKAEDKDAIHKKIETVPDGGGTTIKPALNAALSEIVKCKADIRHVVLLTDGQGETSNFYDVTEAYRDAGVTLSTVAVGMGSDQRLLKSLAEECSGRYYYSDISSDIPKIFAQEVFLSGDTYLQNGDFTLQVDGSNAITSSLFEEGWPDIKGYVSATPKSQSRVLLASDKDDPVLSVMQYGLGHTVAWNTDVTNTWTSGFAGQPDYVQLWKRIIDYSAGNAGIGEDSMDVQASEGSTKITYQAKDYTEQTKVEAVYTGPDGKTQTVKLTATAPGQFEAQIDTEQTGLYTLSVRRMNGEEIENALNSAAVVQYSDEYKFALTNEKYCDFVEQYGRVIKPGENFWKKRIASSRAKMDLTKWLLMLAVLWFVMDIAFRRFCFDPKRTRAYRAVASRVATGRKTASGTVTSVAVGLKGSVQEQSSRWEDRREGDRREGDRREGSKAVESYGVTGNGVESYGVKGKNPGKASEAVSEQLQEHTDGKKQSKKQSSKQSSKQSQKQSQKQEPQALDTAALLKKKKQRNQ